MGIIYIEIFTKRDPVVILGGAIKEGRVRALIDRLESIGFLDEEDEETLKNFCRQILEL